MSAITLLTSTKYPGKMSDLTAEDYGQMINYIWYHILSIETAYEWTAIAHGDTTHFKKLMDMDRAKSIKMLLRKHGCLGEAYHQLLTQSGWIWQRDPNYRAKSCDIGVIDGEILCTRNGSIHYIKDFMQVLAFNAGEQWNIWTNKGIDAVDWRKSDANIRQNFTYERVL